MSNVYPLVEDTPKLSTQRKSYQRPRRYPQLFPHSLISQFHNLQLCSFTETLTELWSYPQTHRGYDYYFS